MSFRRSAIVGIFALIIAGIGSTAFYFHNTTVYFDDPLLEQAIRTVLEMPEERITKKEAARWSDLRLQGLTIQNLRGLEHFTSLESLELGSNQITDISPLANLTRLRWLVLDDNQISDLRPLSKLHFLEYLFLNNNRIFDIKPISNLSALECLSMQNNEDLWDLGPGNPSLWVLRVRGCNIQNLNDLRAFPKLTHLDAGENELTHIDGIESAPFLSVVLLDHNKINRLGEGPGNPALTVLDLSDNALRNIYAFPEFQALEWLTLSSNNLIQIPGIDSLISLKTLTLDSNPLDKGTCDGVTYYKARGIEIEADKCSDYVVAETREDRHHRFTNGVPEWKRRQLEALQKDRNRSITPGYVYRPETQAELAAANPLRGSQQGWLYGNSERGWIH